MGRIPYGFDECFAPVHPDSQPVSQKDRLLGCESQGSIGGALARAAQLSPCLFYEKVPCDVQSFIDAL